MQKRLLDDSDEIDDAAFGGDFALHYLVKKCCGEAQPAMGGGEAEEATVVCANDGPEHSDSICLQRESISNCRSGKASNQRR